MLNNSKTDIARTDPLYQERFKYITIKLNMIPGTTGTCPRTTRQLTLHIG